MSTPTTSRTAQVAFAAGILGSLFIVFGLVKAMQYYTQPPPVNAARIQERKKALAEVRALEAQQQADHCEWIDRAKGQVRLPVARAMEIAMQENKNPAAARSNLLARSEKFNALPPPPAPTNTPAVPVPTPVR